MGVLIWFFYVFVPLDNGDSAKLAHGAWYWVFWQKAASLLSPCQPCLSHSPCAQSTASAGDSGRSCGFQDCRPPACHGMESEGSIPDIAPPFMLSSGSIPSHAGFKRKLTYLLCPLQMLQSVLWWWHVKKRGTEVHKSCYKSEHWKLLLISSQYLALHFLCLAEFIFVFVVVSTSC